jgi:hypothetical protein
MKTNSGFLAAGFLAMAFNLCATPPPYPGIESWGFRKDLAMPEKLSPVPTNDVKFVRGKVDGFESYRIDVAPDGKTTITTEDDEGLRRAVYYYRDRVRAGDLKSCVRKPWVKNRISRCFFGPIKRPPLNHDELMDDVDYYPEAYLDRLAHEGVNGLWLTVEWRDIAETSFTTRSPDADRRLAKLRRTVDRCLEYGIKTWIFCIEPKAVAKDDPLYLNHPDMFSEGPWGNSFTMCTSTAKAQRYIEESVKDIFSRVPRLGGILMIAHGERPTTCLSKVNPVTGDVLGKKCSRCKDLKEWQIYRNTSEAIVRGIRAAGSSAEYISWFYQPHVRPERAPFTIDCVRNVPDGTVFAYNFESGAIKDQVGRFRNGGDYWLSYVGPAQSFKQVAEAGRLAGKRIGAKIQVGNSHEVATVPFVPVPGLLYRKYKAMKEAGVSTVLQCWYFGNYPGVMNKAAGELSFDDFEDGEDEFLRKLAAPYWGKDAEFVAGIWKKLSDAYAEYPLSNDMQYYGPFHAGPAWPLYADVNLKPLGRTWKPLDAPSGDAIGEALENHTIEEALILARRMAKGVDIRDKDGKDALDVLAERWKGDPERLKDIGVMKALKYQFESGSNIIGFYADRAKAIYESRTRGNTAAALAALRRMDEAVVREEGITAKLLPLAKADSRLGFHSEAEAHQYHPAKLEWRLGKLEETRAKIADIAAAVKRGEKYPESEFEKNAPSCKAGGDWTVAKDGSKIRVRDEDNGDMTIDVFLAKGKTLKVNTLDEAGVSWYRGVVVSPDGTVKPIASYNGVSPRHEVVSSSAKKTDGGVEVSFRLSACAWGATDARRPGWIQLMEGFKPLWPDKQLPKESRLNLWPNHAEIFGRIIR